MNVVDAREATGAPANGPAVQAVAVDPLLTRTDLQAIFRLSARTLGRLVAAGGVPPPIIVGRRQRWRREDVERFLRQAAGD